MQHVSTSSPQNSTIVSNHPVTLGLPSASLNWLQTLVGTRGVPAPKDSSSAVWDGPWESVSAGDSQVSGPLV